MKRQVGAEVFEEFINMDSMKLDPSEESFVFVRSKADIQGDKYDFELMLYDIDKSEIRSVIRLDRKPVFQWLSDHELVILGAFDEADRETEGKGIPLTVFSRLDVRDGCVTRMFSINTEVSDFRIAGDKGFLILASESVYRRSWLEEARGDWDKYLEIRKREDRVIRIDEFPFYSDGSGYVSGDRGVVYFCDPMGELTGITDLDFNALGIDSFEDKYGVFYGVDAEGYQKNQGKLFILEYDDMELKCADDSLEYIYSKVQALGPDSVLAMRSDGALHGEYQDEYIDIIDLESGEFTRNNENADWNLSDNVIMDLNFNTGGLSKFAFRDDGFYFIQTVGGSSDIWWADRGDDESLRKVTMKDGKIIDFLVTDRGTEEERIWLMAMRGMRGTEIYLLDPVTGEEEQKTAYNSHINEEYELPEPEGIGFMDSDGVWIDGWAMKPAGYVEGEKYPAILYIHGGPETAYGPVLMHERLALCAAGIGAIFCNPRGSEGRGGDFCDIRGKWMTVDYRDLMEFTDHALKICDWIDEDRVGITGGSYGGIMTNMIIGHTDRFNAAISDRSSAESIADFLLCDLGVACGFDTYQTTPWEDPMELWDQSALKYAPNIKTPVLFIHGEKDYRCPLGNALMLHGAIKYFGGTSEVYVFKGEAHGFSRKGKPQNRKRRIEEMVRWFRKWLI